MLRSASFGLGTAALAVACCAGLPLLAGVTGGVALVPVIGIVGAVIALVCALPVIVRVRRRRGESR
jgi:site-specific recombinase